MIVVRTLGKAEIAVGNHLLKPTSTKKFALLLYLAAERGRHTTRPVLQELLFPELPEKNARHALRELVYQLRQLGVPLETDNDGVGLRSEAVRSDYSEIVEAEQLSDDQVRAVEGGFLPGYAPGHSETYTEWFDAFRSRIIASILRRLVISLDSVRNAGDWNSSESLARACLCLDPLNEVATLALAETFALHGSQTQALDVLERYQAETGRLVHFAAPAKRLHRRIRELPSNAGKQVSQFVGRKGELALLSQLLEGSTDAAQVVCLIGEPGIGKTRLAEQFASITQVRGTTVVRASLSPGHETRPMSAITEMLPQLMEKPGALGCSPSNVAWIQRLLSRTDPSSPAKDLPHESIATSISAAVYDLIDAICTENPLLILLDDIQWMDAASTKFLGGLTRSKHSKRLMLLATGRAAPLLREDEFRSGSLHRLKVTRLAEEDCDAIVAQKLGSALDTDHRHWLVEASTGNPFFLESLLLHLRETGERFTIPKRLTDFVDQRIRSLSELPRHVLAVVTLLGKRASVERLCQTLDIPMLSALSALNELEADGFIVSRDGIEPKHWLIAESAARTTEPIPRKLVHHRIASILQNELQSNYDSSLLWELSEHLIAAGEPRASAALAECAKHAYSIGRARDAGEIYLRAATLSPSHSRSRYLQDAIRAAMVSNEADIINSAYQTLLETTRDIPDDIYLAWLLARIAIEESLQSEFAILRRLFADASRAADLRVKAAWLFVIACDQDKRYDLILESAREIENLWELRTIDEITALRLKLVFFCTAGQREAAPAIARRLLELAAEEPENASISHRRHAAIALIRSGLYEEAQRELLSAYNSAAGLGLYRTEQHLALMLAGLFNDLGDFKKGDEWLAQASERLWGEQDDREGFLRLAIESDRLLRLRDWDALNRIAAKAEHYLQPHWVKRVQTWASSLDLIARHTAGEVLDEAYVRQVTLNGQWEHAEVGETSDFRIATAATILMLQGQMQAADEIATTYLTRYRLPDMPLLSSFSCLLPLLGSARAACPPQLLRHGSYPTQEMLS